jgi:hypothetical protein
MNVCYSIKQSTGLYKGQENLQRWSETLKSIGFTENISDPCLLPTWDEEGMVLIAIYVDACIVIGKEKQISELIDDLRDN